ncbi:MAG: class I tRNA ligase family protein, partial [Spirochaetaceae bacterium]|nr:class I tRNA ligase family protein [Spirochaetaceae bacterium]
DALFTWKDFQEKVNGELIGNLGNLVNRTVSFVSRYYDGVIPHETGSADFWETLRRYEQGITEKLERAELRDAFRQVFELASFANKTFQDGEPWRKRQTEPAAAGSLIRDLCYAVRDIAILIQPYLPGAAERIASFFGLSFTGSAGALSWDCLGQDQGLTRVIKSEVLFPKLEDELVETLRVRYAGSQQDRTERNTETPVSVKTTDSESPAADFAHTLDLRVAQITNIQRHPKADKLYIETLEIAGEERVIVSGLVPFYRPEELLGKRIILAYNLKPAKLRGVESRGMLLAASATDAEGREQVEVLDAGDTPTGTRVACAGSAPGTPPEEIDFATFASVPLVVRDYTVVSADKPLLLRGQPIQTRVLSFAEVH